jgi:hypothetical protein
MKKKKSSNIKSATVLTDKLKNIAKGLSDNLVRNELPSNKQPLNYPAELNPFQSALRKIRLNEYENKKLNEFLEKAISTKSIEELSKTVDKALESGVRINARNEDGFSFSHVAVLKMHYSKFTGNRREDIIRKLELNGADFDELDNFNGLDDKKIIEICNKVKKKVEPQVHDRLMKLREVAENATATGTVENVEIDNKTFFIEFSPNCAVEVAKVVEGAKSLGLSKGDLKVGGNIIKIGSDEVEVKTGENGERDYVDISDDSSFIVTFSTSLGELNVRVYQDVKNYDQIQVEVENKELWNKLQKTGEIVGQGCLFGGISVKTAVEKGYFIRSGRSESTELIKRAEPKSNETISWADKIKSDKTATMERS